MRVLLDTNVVVSAVLFGGVPQQCLRRGLAGDFELVTATGLLDELEHVLLDRFGLPREAVAFIRGDLELAAEVVAPTRVEAVSRDAGDDLVLAAAREGRADYVVTGDRDLLDLGRYGSVAILTPRAFLDRLDPAEP